MGDAEAQPRLIGGIFGERLQRETCLFQGLVDLGLDPAQGAWVDFAVRTHVNTGTRYEGRGAREGIARSPSSLAPRPFDLGRQLEARDRGLELARKVGKLADGFRRLPRARGGQGRRLLDLRHAARDVGRGLGLAARVARDGYDQIRKLLGYRFDFAERLPRGVGGK